MSAEPGSPNMVQRWWALFCKYAWPADCRADLLEEIEGEHRRDRELALQLGERPIRVVCCFCGITTREGREPVSHGCCDACGGAQMGISEAEFKARREARVK